MTISGVTAPRKVIVIGEGEGLRDSESGRVLEVSCLAEFLGPSSLNNESNPNLLNVTREISENTTIFDKTLTNKMFETYSAQTVKIIVTVDADTMLVVVITTMRTWKESPCLENVVSPCQS